MFFFLMDGNKVLITNIQKYIATWCKLQVMAYAMLKRISRYIRLNIGFVILFSSSIASKIQGAVGKGIFEYQGKGSVSLNFYTNSKRTRKIEKTVEVLTL